MKLRKIGFVLLAVIIVFSLTGCNGGVQRFVGGKDKGQVQIDKLLKQIDGQVTRIKVYGLTNSKAIDNGKEVSISQLLNVLDDEKDLRLVTESKEVKNQKAKGNSKNKGIKVEEEKFSINNGLKLEVTLKNGKIFTVKLNQDGDILVAGSKGEEYRFSGGKNVYRFLNGGNRNDNEDKNDVDFSSLYKAETLNVFYRNAQGVEQAYNSTDQAYLIDWVIRSLEKMKLKQVATSFVFDSNMPHLKFTFKLGSVNKNVTIQGDLLQYDGRVYRMPNCFNWMEQRWNQFWNDWNGDKANLHYLYNAEKVEMSYLSADLFTGNYSSEQLPGLKNWILDTILDLPLQKLTKAPITTLELKKNFQFSFKVDGQTKTLRVFDNYVYYNNEYFYQAKNAFNLIEEAWKQFAPPYYGSNKTDPAYVGRADEVNVWYGTKDNLTRYLNSGLQNWAIHSLLSLSPQRTGEFSLADHAERFVIDYNVDGEWFKAVVFEGGLILTVDKTDYYYKLDREEFENLFASWNKLLGNPNEDFTALYSFSEVQMTYRNSSANKGIYNSKQLSYLTPWAVHSLLGLDLIGTNAPTFIEQPRFEFSFGLGERNVSVYVHKNYVNYDGNWYKTRDGKSPFEIIERDWLAVLKN